MAYKTVKDLRALAKLRGLKNYSKLGRDKLERLLAGNAHPKPESLNKPKKPAKSQQSGRSTSKSRRLEVNSDLTAGKKLLPSAAPAHAASVAIKPVSMAAWTSDTRRPAADEERVESAKYATVPSGATAPSGVAADLGEDIDHLPPIAESMLCLLPVKPGLLHGYWKIAPDTVPPFKSLKLRLGHMVKDRFEIIEEFSPPQNHGHWYFRLDESEEIGAVYLQLGHYESDGSFVTAFHRGIARIPSLYASEYTDRMWWVSDEQFRAMYRRSGGFERDTRLGWAASIGSPGGAPGISSHLRAQAGKSNK
ncbi:MAG: hypothetical protein WD823_11685 [Sulfuricaulis sp.]|uniref:hypothetical protein n=1 Tax=Sulfuricaulis sp. TaxID=2003553 RepID=UPI0034A397C7